jgi:integrase
MTTEGLKRKQKFMLIGYCDIMAKREAMTDARRIVGLLNQRNTAPNCDITFAELAAEFKRVRLPQLGAATRNKYGQHLAKHLEPAFNSLKLTQIDTRIVEGWLAAKTSLSWATKTDLKNILSAMFTQATKWRLWSGENPIRHVYVGKRKEVREKRLLSAADLNRLLIALPETIRLMVLIACMLGLRISEILGLRWEDIDFRAGTLRVARRYHRGDIDEPKSDRSKRVRQLGPLAEELARRYPGPGHESQPIFEVYTHHRPRKGETTGKVRSVSRHDCDLNRYFLRPTAKALGLYYKGFGFHAFRRMNITWRQTIGGASPMEAMLAAGHTKLETTSQYFVVDAERERQQVTRMLAELFRRPSRWND